MRPQRVLFCSPSGRSPEPRGGGGSFAPSPRSSTRSASTCPCRTRSSPSRSSSRGSSRAGRCPTRGSGSSPRSASTLSATRAFPRRPPPHPRLSSPLLARLDAGVRAQVPDDAVPERRAGEARVGRRVFNVRLPPPRPAARRQGPLIFVACFLCRAVALQARTAALFSAINISERSLKAICGQMVPQPRPASESPLPFMRDGALARRPSSTSTTRSARRSSATSRAWATSPRTPSRPSSRGPRGRPLKLVTLLARAAVLLGGAGLPRTEGIAH